MLRVGTKYAICIIGGAIHGTERATGECLSFMEDETMKYLKRLTVVAVMAAMVVALVCGQAMAQQGRPNRGPGNRGGISNPGGGNRGPAAAQRRGGRSSGGFDLNRMIESRMQRYKDEMGFSDDEWQAVSPLLKNVLMKQAESMMRGFGGRGRGPEATANPTVDALRKALDDDQTSAAKFKSLIKDYRADVKKKQEELKKARAELLDVLTARQEAYLLLRGILE